MKCTSLPLHRREFITLLGGAAAAWPIGARAQRPERMRRIGVFINPVADDPVTRARLAAFIEGLQQLGWTDGRNVRIDTRWSAGNPDDTRKYAAELVALAPEVIRSWQRGSRRIATGYRVRHDRYC